jgi:hypothetical protein
VKDSKFSYVRMKSLYFGFVGDVNMFGLFFGLASLSLLNADRIIAL